MLRWAFLASALALLAGGSAALAQPAKPAVTAKPAATAKAQVADARSLFDKGVTAHDQGKLDQARDLFERAWAMKKSWDIAANLGIVERELGRPVAAAEHLSFALGALPPSESDETRKGVEHELAKVTPKVARITVRAAVTGAEVRIAGESKGITPIDGPLFAAPGSSVVELRKDGYEPASQRVDAKAGGSAEVSFVLRPSAPRRSIAWGAPAVAFGFGGAGLLTFAVAGTIAVVKLGDLQKSCDRDLVCPRSARDDAEDGRTAANIATAGLALAGAGVAVGMVMLVVPSATAPARVGLSVGPGAVSLKGAF